MLNEYLTTDSFIITSNHTDNIVIHVSEMSKNDSLGTIFGMIDNGFTLNRNQDAFSEIFSIVDYYYYNVHFNQSTDPAILFEKTLKSTNNEIQRMIQNDQVIVNLDNFNIILGLITPSDNQNLVVHLSSYGKINAHLIHKVQLNNYKLVNITNNNEDKNPDNPLTLFSNVISGPLSVKDSVFLCNNNVLNYLSDQEITNIISNLSPTAAVLQLSNLLANFPKTFAGLILKPISIKKIDITDKILKIEDDETPSPDESLRDLMKTKDQTTKILSPFISNTYNKVKSHLKTNFKSIKHSIPKTIISPFSGLPFDNEYLNQSTSKQGTSNSSKITKGRKNIFQKYWNHTYNVLQKMPSKSKNLLLVTIILGLSFYYSVVWLNKRQNREKEADQYRRIVKTIISKKNQAEASIIYQEEEKAKNLVYEINDLVDDIQLNSQEKEDFVSSIQLQVSKLLEKVRHTTIIENLELIKNFSEIDQDINLTKIAVLNNKLYSFDTKSNSIYVLNTESKNVDIIDDLQFANDIKLIKSTGNEILVMDKDQIIRKIEKNGTHSLLASKIPLDSNIVDITSYNNRIYMLDIDQSQILRYINQTNSLKFERNWLKQIADLRNFHSLTIDGSIHLLSDKAIDTFRNGIRYSKQISLAQIDPPLDKALKIYTNASIDTVLILEKNRLIIMNKNGTLKNQYIHNDLKDIQDFQFIEKTEEIILSNQNKIFKFKLL